MIVNHRNLLLLLLLLLSGCNEGEGKWGAVRWLQGASVQLESLSEPVRKNAVRRWNLCQHNDRTAQRVAEDVTCRHSGMHRYLV
jgi:hypothetical protein